MAAFFVSFRASFYDLKHDWAQIPLKIVSSDEQKQDLPQITL
jgi:hypothetical protein